MLADHLGNLADLYINMIAGNAPSILGISLSISTMNSLLGVGILRQFLCSSLNASDVGVLQDFVDTGSLAAFTPIAKAFSDQGETQLLVNITLALQANYATAMAPNEPAIIKLLNSGAVDQLFDAINQITTITVPSNGEKLIDVLADLITAMVNKTDADRRQPGPQLPDARQLHGAAVHRPRQRLHDRGLREHAHEHALRRHGPAPADLHGLSGNQQMVYGGREHDGPDAELPLAPAPTATDGPARPAQRGRCSPGTLSPARRSTRSPRS